MLSIKRDDVVKIITGKDKGKTGKVLHVFPEAQRLLVEKINLVKKARRKTQQNPQGGLVEMEAPIHRSNVMLIDKKGNKPARFGTKVLKDKSKVRISKKSGEEI